MRRHSNRGGIIAIIITIVLTGGLVYIGLSNQRTTSVPSGAVAGADTADHHGGAPGTPADLQALVGKAAPPFQLQDEAGNEYSAERLQGKNVVLFFNEGLMCYPACWNQIASLGQDARFQDAGLNAVVLSVVTDSPKEWQKAVEKMPELGKGTVLYDTDSGASRAFGVLTAQSSMHFGQLPGHTYIVLDGTGTVRHVFDDPNMALHNDELLDVLRSI